MEKEFIPYEQALALKELGFDEPCFGFFVKSDKISMFQECEWEERTNNGFIKDFLNSKYCSTVPTFSQAFRWFREKCGLFSNLDVIDNCATFYYEYQIVNHKDTEFYHDGHQARRLWNNLEFKTYEEAELECLKKLIEIVKKK